GQNARPERAGRYPIVVVISGFTGNNEHNKDVVRRVAQAGYYAIAPELYHREGGMQGKNFQEMGQIAGKVTRAQYLGDIRAAADYAKQQPWARADRLGVTGFCGGGALTLHFAAEYPGVAARVRLRRPAAGLQEGSVGGRVEAVRGVLRQASEGVGGSRRAPGRAGRREGFRCEAASAAAPRGVDLTQPSPRGWPSPLEG